MATTHPHPFEPTGRIPLESTLHQVFEQQVQRTPEAIALRFEAEQFTYFQLNDKAEALAGYLAEQGVQPGSRVAICHERYPGMLVAVLAALKAGATYVPIDPDLPAERIALILADTEASALLTQFHLQPVLPAFSGKTIYIDSQWREISSQKRPYPRHTQGPADFAYIVYTSGSTGLPKGVPILHRSVLNIIQAMADALDFQPTDALLALSSFSFDVCVMDFFLPLTHGGRVVLMRQKDAFQMKNIARVLVESDVTVMVQGPVIWRSLLEAGWTGKPDLKIVNTAEHLSQELANRLLPLGKGLWNAYGPSEITIFSSIGRITPDAPEVHIGQPAANTRYYLVDEQGGLIEDADQPGELLIAGMGICPAGYLNQPELTREKYLPNPFSSDPQYALAYRSGDRVRRLPNGNYAYIGRLDYQIKLRGFRIELGEIEAALEQHPAVRQAVAVVRQLDHPASDPQILAFVTITPQPVDLPGAEPLTARDLKKFLTRKLPVYAVPAAIVMVDRFPLTATGKVDRKRLPIPEGVIRPNGSVYIPPEEPFQEQLVGLWEQILSVSPIGIDDNLFDLGGHSLHVIQLVTAMEASLNVTIAADLVLTHPTIRQLSLAFGKTQSTLYANVYRPFVGFNTQGQKTPIFATHPLPDFARCFGWDRPFYGICQTYLSQEIPLAERSLDRVLALLLTEIRALQPRGPYNLMGYCVRSPIAWSLAAALEAEGEQVTLMLVDPNLPPPCVNIPFLLYFAMLPGLRFRVSGPSPTRRPRRRPPRPIQFTFKQPHGSNFDAYRLRPDTRARLQQMLFLQANIHTYFHFEDLTIHYANYHLPTLQAPVTFFLSSTLLQGICRFYLREIERHWAPRSAQAEIILPDIIHQKISGLAGAQTIGPIMETKFH